MSVDIASRRGDEVLTLHRELTEARIRIKMLEAALREIASRDSKTIHPGEAIAIAAQALK